MSPPREVRIDGVRYVPAASVIVNHDQLLRALVVEWAGENADLSDPYLNSLRVIVTDGETEGTPVREFVDKMAARLVP